MDRAVVISRRLAYSLRHRPEVGGLTLDPHGWAPVADVLAALRRSGLPLGHAELAAVVATDDKERYALTGDALRANQGHTVPADLELPVLAPGDAVARDLAPVRREHPGGRAVPAWPPPRAPPDRDTAARVAARRPPSVIISVDAGGTAVDVHQFRRSANGVLLVGHVSPRYLRENA